MQIQTHLGNLLLGPLNSKLLSPLHLLLPFSPLCSFVFLRQHQTMYSTANAPQMLSHGVAARLVKQTLTFALCLSFAYCSDRTCLLVIWLVNCPTVGPSTPVSLLRFLLSFLCSTILFVYQAQLTPLFIWLVAKLKFRSKKLSAIYSAPLQICNSCDFQKGGP